MCEDKMYYKGTEIYLEKDSEGGVDIVLDGLYICGITPEGELIRYRYINSAPVRKNKAGYIKRDKDAE